ncbi:MAG: prolyl endopeptidase [Benniella sp.]|nr:MAG: prolyl endopeptidase [Benniella sp.]
MIHTESDRIKSLDGKIVYPHARRSDFTFAQHGTIVADPYRWLEEADSEETKAFVAAQTAFGQEYMNKYESKDKFNKRLTQLFNFERYSAPRKHGDYYYYLHNTGLQPQSVLYQRNNLDGDENIRTFLDINELEGGKGAMTTWNFSESGKLFGYGVARLGTDWTTLYLMDNQGNKLPDKIEWTKFTKMTFTHDDKGFFYSSFERPKDAVDGELDMTINQYKHVYYHKIGTSQSEDIIVYVDKEHPTYHPDAIVSEDGRYILIVVAQGCDNLNNVYLVDLEAEGYEIKEDSKLITIADDFSGQHSYLTNKGTTFYFQSNRNAPLGKIVKYDMARPEEGFIDVVPEAMDVLSISSVIDHDKLVLQYTRDVKSVLNVHDLATGTFLYEIKIPVGTVAGIIGHTKDSDLFIQFLSYLTPGTIYRYNFRVEDESERLTIFKQATVQSFDSSMFETKQVFYESKDGTRVPMFVTHKKGLQLDGKNPTLLTGYGGYGVTLQAAYTPQYIVFIQHLNGVVAHAGIRGGGEYGEMWHKAGVLRNKQNSFDDFIWAIEYLIREQYTQPSLVAINGASNGGLLVSAVLNQVPDRIGCVVSDVGPSDMLRFHKFTIGANWQSDYGRPDDSSEDFHYLLKYSPLHTVHKKHPYPAVALFTSTMDDRVVPLHAYKFVAELQYTAGPLTTKPLVVRVESDAGHGLGKPLTKRLEEITDKFAFIAWALDAKWMD